MSVFSRIVRGPAAARVLAALGIDARRYWLLMDLFRHLSERRDMFSQLGRDDTSLKTVTLLYFAMAALASVVAVLVRAESGTYFYTSLIFSNFVILSILLPETSNSLVNPVESLVLAHQPITGATYTAAKLSHLLRIVVYLEGGLNLVPALAGVLLPNAPWFYPLVHLGAALAVGLVAAMSCCALFGWLMRFLPPQRLKAAGQLAEIAPWAVFLLRDSIGDVLHRSGLLQYATDVAAAGPYLPAAGALLAAGAIALGIRALSADYLVRVTSIVHGRRPAASQPRPSLLENVTARWFGGPPSRAGYAYVSRMMRRDWHFRRQMLPMVVVLIGPALVGHGDLLRSPFAGGFAPIHLLPHAIAFALFMICILLTQSTDHKGAWLFLLAPARAIGGFARGIYALLWLAFVALPHAILLPVLAWRWGLVHAALFIAYSLAAASVYLALELRLIDGLPFGRPPDANRSASFMAVAMGGGVAIAVAVGIQHFFVFQALSTVALAAVLLAAAAYIVTRSSLAALEGAIDFHLTELSGQYGRFYREVQV